MDSEGVRFNSLGFKPQKEIIYNSLLPYAEELDAESQYLLREIKTNICKAILHQNDIDISFWTMQTSRYLSLYGRKFSKEDHVFFIKIFFELLILPDIELDFVKKVAGVLQLFLKKDYLLSRQDLQLPWRPFYDLYERIFFSSCDTLGMQIIPCNMDTILKNLIRTCSVYFPVESTQEILEELRPLMCPFDSEMARAIGYFECFLCTALPPDQHDHGFKLWFEDFMAIWDNWHNIPTWENTLVHLLARLAKDNIGYINWEPYVPKIFTRLLRSFNLPGRENSIHVVRAISTFDTASVSVLIASILGSGSCCQLYISKMFKALESFYHPSNFGRWLVKIQRLLQKLPQAVTARLHKERYEKPSWKTGVPDSAKLTDEDVTEFVNSVLPSVLISMFSKRGAQDASLAFLYLACLRPELVIPPLLERLTSSLETLTEPHRLLAAMQCITPVCRPLVLKNRHFPGNQKHLVPLLMNSLPGIDANDISKCLVTCQFLSVLGTVVLFVDSSSSAEESGNLSEEDQLVCSDTRLFEDFVLQLMDRIFTIIENSCAVNASRLDRDSQRTNLEENVLEVGLASAFGVVLSQSSPAIYKVALQKLRNFVTSHIFEPNLVSGKFTANLCRVMCKIDSEQSLSTFLPYFSELVFALTESEDALKEETLDHELTFSLLILSELAQASGNHLLKYQDLIVKVLQRSLRLMNREGYSLGCKMLKETLRAYVQFYNTEQWSYPDPFGKHAPKSPSKYLEYWGVPGNIHQLEMHHHIPSAEELEAAKAILKMFLMPELQKLKDWAEKKLELSREEINRSLSIVSSSLNGAAFALPMWEEEQINLGDTKMPLYKPKPLIVGKGSIDIDGRNVRHYICEVSRQVLGHMAEFHEDDTKAYFKIIKLYNLLVFNWGVDREDYDRKKKTVNLTKKMIEDKLRGEKRHIRSLLIERVLLQHEIRVIDSNRHYFTQTHADLMKDMIKLSASHYSEVRKNAQIVLQNYISFFNASHKIVLPEILDLLNKDPTLYHEEFKGVLHVITGTKKNGSGGLLLLRNWKSVGAIWPAILSSKHSEKPSIIRLINSFSAYLQKHYPTFQITLKIPENCLKIARDFLTVSNPSSSPTSEEFSNFTKELEIQNSERKSNYLTLVHKLINSLQSEKLHWRHYQLGLNMLTVLIRFDVPFPKEGVQLFVNHLVHDTLAVRKLALQGLLSIMKQQKQKIQKTVIDPTIQNLPNMDVHPLIPRVEGDVLPDNMWLQYNSLNQPDTEEKWNSRYFVHKPHWGFNTWPKNFKVHALDADQPKQNRSFEELSEEQKPIYEAFSQKQFLDKLISYLSLEEKKDHDKFDTKKSYLFKYLMSHFGEAFLPQLITHLQKMTVEKQESVQRCAAEITSGILCGTKHWNFAMMHRLRDEMCPILDNVVRNVTPETIADWGSCITSFSEDRDPNKYYWLVEFFMKEPPSVEYGSFMESSWLHFMMSLVFQFEWRACELLHRCLQYILTKLDHSYQNVRLKLGNFLVYIFLYDIPSNAKMLAYTPKLVPFINSLLPTFAILESSCMDDDEVSAPAIEDSPEKKSAKNLFLTLCRWITLNGSKTLLTAPSTVFQLLPLLCHMVHDSTDEVFKRECATTIAVLAQALLDSESIEAALTTLQSIASNKSWHSRVTAAAFVQQMVFSNLFTIINNEHWTEIINNIVLKLLQDDRVEVRESAAETLCGFFHCEYFKINEALIQTFRSKCQKKLKFKRSANNGSKTYEASDIKERHAAILGLCSCVNAYPYDVPEFMPDILVLLGDHLNDPQPISGTIKTTLSSFRRTHHDNWRDHKLKFTDDQLAVITDLLISPCYYA